MKQNAFFFLVLLAVQSAAFSDVPKSIFDDDWKSDAPQQAQPPATVIPTPTPTPTVSPTPTTPDPTVAPTPTPTPAPAVPIVPPVVPRLAVPTSAAQADSWKLIKEDLYKDDIANAKTPAQKVELAGKLLAVAQDTKNDAVGKYVLLAQAKELAIRSGDPPTAFKCLDQLGETYSINYPVMKLDLFAALAKTVSSPADGQTLVEGLNRWADVQVKSDRYDAARRACDIAQGVAQREKDVGLSNQTQLHLKQIRLIEAGYISNKPAILTLASSPKDPAANLAVGQFYCFLKAEWDRGLPLLALGSDAELRGLAKKELAGVSLAAAQVELGDQWWALSETEKGLERDRLREHAAKWYEEAEPSLEGLAKAKVEKRLKEVEALAGAGLPARGATNSLGMRFVAIQPGTFTMGSSADEAGRFDNETQHKVTLTKGFLMAATHVTRGQFAAFVRDSGYRTEAEKDGWGWEIEGKESPQTNGASWRTPGFDQQDDHPVVEVSWNDAAAFCDWLSRKERKHYRLPTEAEWEYAARGGTQTSYPWGNNPDDGRGWANSGDQTANQRFPNINPFNWTDGYVFTSPVAKFKPNGFGLYDMIGNAWEWCSDWLSDFPDGDVTDPRGPDNGGARVLRGGSWSVGPRVRCACRIGVPPIYRVSDLGFRVVLDADSGTQSPAQRTARSKDKLVIIRAVFGDLPSGGQADVTARVAAAVSDNRLRIDASRDNFGDPAYGHLKRLWVDYTLGGIRNSKSVVEDETLVIP